MSETLNQTGRNTKTRTRGSRIHPSLVPPLVKASSAGVLAGSAGSLDGLDLAALSSAASELPPTTRQGEARPGEPRPGEPRPGEPRPGEPRPGEPRPEESRPDKPPVEDISAHLPMVRYLARRIHERLPSHVEMDDLVSAGLVGLMDAYQKFNPAKQVQFRSYAQFRVRGAILDSLRTLDWSPRELRRKGRAVEEAIQVLTRRWGRSPDDQEIAAEMGTTLEQYQQLLGELKGLEIGTLNAERSEDSGEEELAYLPNSPTEDPLFRCLKSELHTRLVSAIEQLSERERLVLSLYYFEELTMKEIGATLGVVESRISQLHSSAVLRLRALLQTEALHASPEPEKRRPRR